MFNGQPLSNISILKYLLKKLRIGKYQRKTIDALNVSGKYSMNILIVVFSCLIVRIQFCKH